ncbi:MAG: acyl-CoA thioesterase [Propylenella sp.]
MFVNTRTIEMEWGDCDPAGIVFYPRYFAYFDACTAHLLDRALGMKKIAWTRHYGVVGTPMVETRASFKVPSRFGDVLTIETRVKAFRRSSFDIEHRLLKESGALAVEGFETRVWTGRDPDDPTRLRSVPIPQEVIERLRG